jgi:hypothetical protein
MKLFRGVYYAAAVTGVVACIWLWIVAVQKNRTAGTVYAWLLLAFALMFLIPQIPKDNNDGR